MSLCSCMLRRWPTCLASRTTPRQPLFQSRSQIHSQRWNSSKSPPSRPATVRVIPPRPVAAAAGKGWTTLRVLGVVVVTAIAAGSFATKQAKFLELKERDYSSPTKFHEPKYATIQEMEAVSTIKNSSFVPKISKLNGETIGHQGNPKSM